MQMTTTCVLLCKNNKILVNLHLEKLEREIQQSCEKKKEIRIVNTAYKK